MTQEQLALMQRARGSLSAARLLAGENLADDAASRSYYAMFHAAQALLLGKGLTYAKHGSVKAAFGQHFVKTGQIPAQIHRYLIDAYDSRLVGDYGVTETVAMSRAEEMIAQAEEFIIVADQILNPPPSANNPSQSDPK